MKPEKIKKVKVKKDRKVEKKVKFIEVPKAKAAPAPAVEKPKIIKASTPVLRKMIKAKQAKLKNMAKVFRKKCEEATKKKAATYVKRYRTAKAIAKKMFDGISDKSAGEVADILYTKDPKEKYQIVKQLLNESKKSGDSLRSTEAAQKLQAFYAISDKLSNLGKSKALQDSFEAKKAKQPLKITIRPQNKGDNP